MHYFKKVAVAAALSLCLALPAYAAGLTDSQISSILNLLTSFGVDQSTYANVSLALHGQATPAATATTAHAPGCTIVRTLALGATGDDVSCLQQLLTQTGDYTYSSVTGYFGQETQTAVQKYQARMNIISSGTPETSGYGAVGPKTQAALLSADTTAATAPTPAVTTTAPATTATAPTVTSPSVPSTSQPSLVAAATVSSTNIPNGQVCTASTQCSSGYCYPGPESKSYCIAQSANCAQPGTDGAMFGATYTYNGSTYSCIRGGGLQNTGIANGQVCTASTQCSSGYCYPGPESKSYCIAQSANCAQPGTDGAMFGATYTYNGSTYSCIRGGGLQVVSSDTAAATTRDTTRMSDLQTIKSALEQYFLANGTYPGSTNTYYWISDNNYTSGGTCASGGLAPYISGLCNLKDPQGHPYGYALNADGTYTLGAMFETAAYKSTGFTWGSNHSALANYYNSGIVAKAPSSFCLSPSSNFRATAQHWLDNGHSLCLTAGDFDVSSTDGSAGLTIDGSKVSLNNLYIKGAGATATTLHSSSCGKVIELKGTLRNLDVGNFGILGGITSYYTDGTTPTQCSQQIAIGDEVGSSNIVNANIHNLAISNVRLGVSLMGGCTSYTQPSSGSCYCTGTACHVNNVIQDNTIKNIYGMRYQDASGHWIDQSTGTAIGSQVEQGLIIRRNTIQNVSRHSIYISFGFPDGSYYIKNNTITDHRATGIGLVDFANLTSAIVVARSQSYSEILDNIITNSKAFGISVETGPIDGGTALVSGNSFSGGAMPDIWVSSTGPVTLTGNTDGGASASCTAGPSYNQSCASQTNITVK